MSIAIQPSKYQRLQREKKRTILKKLREYKSMKTKYGTLPQVGDIEDAIKIVEGFPIEKV